MSHELLYMTEGTGQVPSSHKALSAERVLDASVGVVGVRGPEPNHISSAAALINAKWRVFMNGLPDEPRDAIYMAMDVVATIGIQGETPLDVRKQTEIVELPERRRNEALAKKVASDAAIFGDKNIMLTLEPAVQVGKINPVDNTAVIASGVARGYIMLPENPLRDQAMFGEYIAWSGLAEKLHGSIPGGYDVATLLAFLAKENRLGDYKPEDLTLFPGSYVEDHTNDPKYVETGLEFFAAQGRIPDGMVDVLGPVLTVQLLDYAFNTPKDLLPSVVSSLSKIKPISGRVLRRNPIEMRGKMRDLMQ